MEYVKLKGLTGMNAYNKRKSFGRGSFSTGENRFSSFGKGTNVARPAAFSCIGEVDAAGEGDVSLCQCGMHGLKKMHANYWPRAR